jgi:hypothetical protein
MTTSEAVALYRCKHSVEAKQWHDTDELREVFATWFERHDAMFETRGPVVSLPEGGQVDEGEWIVFSDGEFIAMEDWAFRDTYDTALRSPDEVG